MKSQGSPVLIWPLPYVEKCNSRVQKTWRICSVAAQSPNVPIVFPLPPTPLSCITSFGHVTLGWIVEVAVGRVWVTHQAFPDSSLSIKLVARRCFSWSCICTKWKREKQQITYAWGIIVDNLSSAHCWWLPALIKLMRYFSALYDMCCIHQLLLHAWSLKLSHLFLISWRTIPLDPRKQCGLWHTSA